MTEEILKGLEEALAYGGDTHTIGDVVELILEGEAKLWVADGAVIITQFHEYPRQRVIHFWLATGAMADVVALSYRVMNWAKGEGCVRATLAGRRGWERALKSEGWAPELIVMGREI